MWRGCSRSPPHVPSCGALDDRMPSVGARVVVAAALGQTSRSTTSTPSSRRPRPPSSPRIERCAWPRTRPRRRSSDWARSAWSSGRSSTRSRPSTRGPAVPGSNRPSRDCSTNFAQRPDLLRGGDAALDRRVPRRVESVAGGLRAWRRPLRGGDVAPPERVAGGPPLLGYVVARRGRGALRFPRRPRRRWARCSGGSARRSRSDRSRVTTSRGCGGYRCVSPRGRRTTWRRSSPRRRLGRAEVGDPHPPHARCTRGVSDPRRPLHRSRRQRASILYRSRTSRGCCTACCISIATGRQGRAHGAMGRRARARAGARRACDAVRVRSIYVLLRRGGGLLVSRTWSRASG